MFKSVALAFATVITLALPSVAPANAQTGFNAHARAAFPGTPALVRTRATATPGINARIRRQALRIRRGVRIGSLNRFETRILRRGLRRIQFSKWNASRDGVVTTRERVRLHRQLDRNSHRIRRLVHNGRS